MKPANIGAFSYGVQALSVIIGQLLFIWLTSILDQNSTQGFSSNSVAVIRELNLVFSDLLGIAAIGGVALTWLVLGRIEAKRLFVLAGLGSLITIGSYIILHWFPASTGSFVDLSASALYVITSLVMVLAFVSAAKLFGISFLLYAGVLSGISLIGSFVFSIVSYLGPMMGGVSDSSPAVGQLYLALSALLRSLPILIPVLAFVGFMELRKSTPSKGFGAEPRRVPSELSSI